MKMTILKLAVLALSVNVLIFQTACTSSRSLSCNQVMSVQNEKTYLILHTPNNKYIINHYNITEESFQGQLAKYKDGMGKNSVHLSTRIMMDINDQYGKMVEINKDLIYKIEYIKSNPWGTFFVIAGSLGAMFFVANYTTQDFLNFKSKKNPVGL
mgnify:CR=1 FL=1